jgi:MFS family permease
MVTVREAVPATEPSRTYTTYLTIVALAGWALTSYDMNLLVLTIPDISQNLGLSQSQVGSLIFFGAAAQFVVALLAGCGMDTLGRKLMCMLCLTATAVFTGLTYFAESFWRLTVMRMLASGSAMAELVVSITIANEQVPERHRGLLYSLVQGGWPLGVFLASGVFLLFGHLGWRVVFLLGVIPIVMVLIGRMFIRESDRFLHLQEMKKARAGGDEARLRRLRTTSTSRSWARRPSNNSSAAPVMSAGNSSCCRPSGCVMTPFLPRLTSTSRTS